MYYSVIKHEAGAFEITKEMRASVFYFSPVFPNECFMLLHLLYDTEVMWRKTVKHAFSVS